MSESKVYYKKSKRIYLVLSATEVPVKAFSNIKACVSWCNKLPSMQLVLDLKYQSVVHQLSKVGSFPFGVGGSTHYIRVMPLHGTYITSKRLEVTMEKDQKGNVIDDSQKVYEVGIYKAVFRSGFNDFQVFDGGIMRKTFGALPDAQRWVDTMAEPFPRTP